MHLVSWAELEEVLAKKILRELHGIFRNLDVWNQVANTNYNESRKWSFVRGTRRVILEYQ